MNKQRNDIDSIITFILVKKLVTPIVRSDAYKLGLVNNSGKILREPVGEDEREALTILDKIVFKLKRLLGNKIINLQSFLYLQTMNQQMYNKLIVKGSVENRAEILRIVKDVKRISESAGKSFDDVLMCILKEEIEMLGG
jgi:chemotaxis signal transduction protein